MLKDKIVVCKDPRDARQYICKRVAFTSKYSNLFNPVPRGSVYLLGDSSDNSIDSRNYGPVPIGLIQGIVIYKVRLFYFIFSLYILLLLLLQVSC